MGLFDLNGMWTLSYGPQADGMATLAELERGDWPEIPATVPGNVELDLMRAGVLPDIVRGYGIYSLRPFEGYRWWYRRSMPSPAVSTGETVDLVFDGIDCCAEVFLNGSSLGTADNMLIPHRFDVTALLRADGRPNELAIRIDSAVIAGRAHEPAAWEGAGTVNWESLAIRKAPHMYGWDILPRIVSAGLWRGVRLETIPATRFGDCYVVVTGVNPAANRASIAIDWHLITNELNLDDWQLSVTLSHDHAVVHDEVIPLMGNHGRHRLSLNEARLWWPRGYGAQPLYDLVLTMRDGTGAIRAERRERIGLRTVRLERSQITSDETPGEFRFIVNGEPIFVKGTNWVPLDALHSRDSAHLDTVFEMVTDLNCTMLRCWGGNVYEDTPFFDACDRAGVLVWQDFALACALYPQTDAFAAALRREAEYIIKKLRNHPCLALWAGNNEIDAFCEGWLGYRIDPGTDRTSREVLATAVRLHDPCRDYLPSSPYHSPEWVAQGRDARREPEAHLWGPRDDFKGSFYADSSAHFVSEIGYHGCPDRATLEAMLDTDRLWPWQDNDQWLTHAVRPHPAHTDCNYRIALMARQAAFLFGAAPENLDDFIDASQISQAEALKFFIEWARMGKWRRTGMLWWNLRDGWPVISDAVVDYYNRKKRAYATIKRLQANVCAMVAEAKDGRHAVIVVNDTLADVRLPLTIRDADTGQTLFSESVTIPRNGIAVAGSIPAIGHAAMWLIEWTIDGAPGCNHYLAGPRPFNLDRMRRWLKLLESEN